MSLRDVGVGFVAFPLLLIAVVWAWAALTETLDERKAATATRLEDAAWAARVARWL